MIINKKSLAMGIFCAMLLAGGVAGAETPDVSTAIQATAVPAEQTTEKKEPTMAERMKAILQPEQKKDGIKAGNLYIPKDTKITLELVNGISSKTSKKGNTVHFKTQDNLIINGTVVIPKDEEVEGVVVDAHGNRLFGGGGKLVFNIPYVTTINGVQIPVNGYVDGHGGGDGGAVAVAAAVSLIGGLFMKGKNISYEAGQLVTVTVQKDTDINATPDNLKDVMNPTQPRGMELTVKPA